MSVLRLAFVAVLSTLAGACGFHPLYGPTASGANLSEVMRTIDVAMIPSRTGQHLRNELIFANTGGGAASKQNGRSRRSTKPAARRAASG